MQHDTEEIQENEPNASKCFMTQVMHTGKWRQISRKTDLVFDQGTGWRLRDLTAFSRYSNSCRRLFSP